MTPIRVTCCPPGGASTSTDGEHASSSYRSQSTPLRSSVSSLLRRRGADMSEVYLPFALATLVLFASLISIRFALSVAIVEIALGVVGGNLLHMESTAWIDFLAGFGGVLLTFLAGAEVDTGLLREKFKESALIGGLSFLIPFVAAFAYLYFAAGWGLKAAEIGGAALSTTSLAVVYAVLVETGLTSTATGKIIMAACFVTDFGTAAALSILFIEPP